MMQPQIDYGTFPCPNEDQNEYELRVVATASGQVTAQRNVGYWRGHYFCSQPDGSEALVVYHDSDISLLRPEDGALLGGYPRPA